MTFHTAETFSDVIQALPPAHQSLSDNEAADLRLLIEDALELRFGELGKSTHGEEFDKWVEIKQFRSKEGGRPKDASMNTLVLALADIYAKTTDQDVEDLPIAASSWFAGFMNACLRPIFPEKDLAVALAGRWEDLRAVMRRGI